MNEATAARTRGAWHRLMARRLPPSLIRPLLWRGLWVMLLALALTELFLLPNDHLADKARLLTLTTAVILLGHLLRPSPAPASLTLTGSALWWSLVVAAAGMTIMPLTSTGAPNQISFVPLALAIFAISLVLQGLTQLIAACKPTAPASALALMLAILCGAAPLWLGPWAAAPDSGQAVTDGIVAISPLSYLAVTIDYDYLRSEWFYQHAPFGALRYHYPSAILLGVAYLLPALAGLRWAEHRRTSKTGPRKSRPFHLLEE